MQNRLFCPLYKQSTSETESIFYDLYIGYIKIPYTTQAIFEEVHKRGDQAVWGLWRGTLPGDTRGRAGEAQSPNH